MIKRYAIIKSGVVRQVIRGEWEETPDWANNLGTIVEVQPDVPVAQGWNYDGAFFTPSLEKNKQEKIISLKSKALAQVQAVFPSIQNVDEFKLVQNILLSIAPAARAFTDDVQTLVTIRSNLNAALGAVTDAVTLEDVEAVDLPDL